MPEQSAIRIFISSPSDVRPERLKAEQIVVRLDREFVDHFHVEAVMWEREPLLASHHPQEQMLLPRECDIVVVILWSRLGTILPKDKFPGPLSKKEVTGTEWEFEDALAGIRVQGRPHLLLYRKTAKPIVELDDREALKEKIAQLDLLEDFISRWFQKTGTTSIAAASHSFLTTTGFEEELYDNLRVLLERRAGAATEGMAIRWHGAPFRGLLSFEYNHAQVFFGRTRERNELRELLARQEAVGCSFILILGASGSGKSSLVKAGLVPDLQLPGMISRVGLVRWGLLRPSDAGGNPLIALSLAILSATALPELASMSYATQQLAELLRESPAQATLPIQQGLAAAGEVGGLAEIAEARLLLIVDQLEELFTIEGSSQLTREAFVRALEALAKSGLVWVVATMRSDFFDRLETIPTLASLSSDEGRFLLLPPNENEIGQIIRQPAHEAGLSFEIDTDRGIGLDEIIRKAATAEKGALPLLSFMLDQLWRRRRRPGVLTFAAYEELGGLEGAISRRAEEVFQNCPASIQKELVAVLRAVVTVEGGTATSRPAPLSLFPINSPRRLLIDALLEPGARLLVADRDIGEAQLRLAHEALLTHWPRARDLVAAEARDLELRGRLEQEAKRWRAAPRRDKDKRVITDLILAEALALVARWNDELPEQITEFVTASRIVAARKRRRLFTTVVCAVAALPMSIVLVWAMMIWWGVRSTEQAMAFATIPSGCFEMGSPESETERYENEGPVHHVCVASFEIGKFEVMQAQWRSVMVHNADPSHYKGSNRPVESVSWSDAKLFVRLMSIFGKHHYQLPSEAEWEYAARAGTQTARYWGEHADDGCSYENMADLNLKKISPDIVPIFANCDDGHTTTAPVGSFKPNPFGLYDMLGNVAEWVEDCYVNKYRAAPGDGSPVLVPDCVSHMARGGSWGYSPRALRAANRDDDGGPAGVSSDFGFRVIRSISSIEEQQELRH